MNSAYIASPPRGISVLLWQSRAAVANHCGDASICRSALAEALRIGQRGTLEQAELDAKAAHVRAAGLSYRAIAVRMGCSESSSRDRVARALAAAPVESVQELRAVEEARLDVLWRAAYSKLDTPQWQIAIDRLLRISERRARLLGLDAPAKTALKVITEDAVDAAIRHLEAELERSDQ